VTFVPAVVYIAAAVGTPTEALVIRALVVDVASTALRRRILPDRVTAATSLWS
jgi:Mg/Co/Ni transporter MgtE